MLWDSEELDMFKKKYTKLTRGQFNELYNFQEAEKLGKGSYANVFKVKSNKGQYLAIKEFNK